MTVAINSAAANSPFSGDTLPRRGINRHVPPAYGIREAIELVHKLSDLTTELSMPVITTTLESANVDIIAIIADAQHREDVLESRSIELITQIESLEAQVSKLSEEIMTITAGLEDTIKVKNLLLLALETSEGEGHAQIEQLLAESETIVEWPVEEEQDATFAKFQATLR